MGPVLVFGHRHPDNDSICSAVAYAHLKNLTDPESVYVPVRLGPVPRETAWVFARFGVELPEEIDHVRTRVRDVMTEEVVTVQGDNTMHEAGTIMRERNVRALPVLDDGVVHGLLNAQILAGRYIEEIGLHGFRGMPTEVGLLARVLDGEILAGDAEASVAGDVFIGAMEPTTMLEYVKPGDMLIVGDRMRTQPLALERGVACLVVTGGRTPPEDVIALANERGAAVILTPHDTFSAARLVSLSHRAADLMDTSVLLVDPEMLLSEAAEDLLTSPHREAVVVDAQGHPVGILTRTDVAHGIRRRVVLVDHNEAAQSALGIEEASVVEIVDHHRVGDIQTTGPILFLNMPVGSTASIVASRYENLGVPIPAPTAGLLLSAILTDTVLLKSPTTTTVDREVAERLAAIAGVEPLEFGMEVIGSRSTGEPFSAERSIAGDVKEYRVGDAFAAVAQVETIDLASILAHSDELHGAMEAARAGRGYDLFVLMVTDIVREGSEILAVGKTRVVERALGISLTSGSAWMPGVLSRKKQVAARLVEAAGV